MNSLNPSMTTSALAGLIIMILLPGCVRPERDTSKAHSGGEISSIYADNGRFVLMAGQDSMFLKGVTTFGHFDKVPEYGGNSIRIWDSDSTLQQLDLAWKKGLKVLLVLNMMSERQGMDYNNREWIIAQRARLSEKVKAYREHPAVYIWSLGNELDLGQKSSSVWQELDTLSRIVRTLDPRRLVTTSIMPRRETLRAIAEQCPEIEIIGVNSFGYAPDVQRLLGGLTSPWKKPYFFSEWGPKGYWEVPMTDWGASFEATSYEKTQFMQEVYLNHILPHKDQCLGAFAFFWDFKQERTHTWFSFFDQHGRPSTLVNGLQSLWTQELAQEPSLRIEDLSLNGMRNGTNIYLQPGQTYRAASQPNGPNALTCLWEIRPEGDYHGINGGDKEPQPEVLNHLIHRQDLHSLSFTSPTQEGPYRLYYKVMTSEGLFATANLCFFVMEES